MQHCMYDSTTRQYLYGLLVHQGAAAHDRLTAGGQRRCDRARGRLRIPLQRIVSIRGMMPRGVGVLCGVRAVCVWAVCVWAVCAGP